MQIFRIRPGTRPVALATAFVLFMSLGGALLASPRATRLLAALAQGPQSRGGSIPADAERVRVLRVRVTPDGFDRDAVEIPAGRRMLLLRNLTGLQEPVTVTLLDEGGRAIASRTLPRGRDVEALVDLERGTYTALCSVRPDRPLRVVAS